MLTVRGLAWLACTLALAWGPEIAWGQAGGATSRPDSVTADMARRIEAVAQELQQVQEEMKAHQAKRQPIPDELMIRYRRIAAELRNLRMAALRGAGRAGQPLQVDPAGHVWRGQAGRLPLTQPEGGAVGRTRPGAGEQAPASKVDRQALLAKIRKAYKDQLEREPNPELARDVEQLIRDSEQPDNRWNFMQAIEIVRRKRLKAGIPLLLESLVEQGLPETQHMRIRAYLETLAMLTGERVGWPG